MIALPAMTVGYDDTEVPASIVDLRPMDIGDILDNTIRIYRYVPLVLILTYGIIAGIPLLLQQSSMHFVLSVVNEAIAMMGPNIGTEFLNVFQSADFYAAAGIMGIGMFLMFFLGPMAQAAMVYIVSETILGRETNIGDSIKVILPKVGTIILAYIMVGIIILVAYAPIIISMTVLFSNPANEDAVFTALAFIWLYPISALVLLWLTIKLLFIPHSVILDDLGAVDAFKRSFSLVTGYWWRTFGIYILISFIVGFIVGMLQQLAGLISLGLNQLPAIPPMVTIGVAGLLMTIIQLVIQPIGIIATTLLYYDLRIRKEGFDLLHLASALAKDSEPELMTASEHEPFG
jgi:hypothetical protein